MGKRSTCGHWRGLDGVPIGLVWMRFASTTRDDERDSILTLLAPRPDTHPHSPAVAYYVVTFLYGARMFPES